MQYTLTKYLTADYLRENDFLKAYLELVDEIIFCCSMESLDVLSNMSFESMDDNYFLAYQNFFLNGLSTYDINKLDKLVLSEWFSLLHVRGELSDIDKLLKFGGSLKNKEKNVFELYHNADVPNQPIDTTKDGLIYLITENNIDLDSDYFINQQVPAGYRIGLMRTPPPKHVKSGDVIYLGTKETDFVIHVKSGDKIILNKKFEGDITFYRRRQFDQYYTFGQVYRSQYTINQLSQYHQKGFYFFGFELDHTVPLPVEYHTSETVFGGGVGTYGEYYIGSGTITIPPEPSHEQYSFYVLDENGNIVNSSKGFVDHLVCDRYNILEDSGVQHLRVHDGLVGYMAGNNPVIITPSSFGAVLYKSDGTTAILRDSSKEYTIRHVLIDEFTVADEYLPQLYISDIIPAILVVKMNSGTYDSVEIYQIEYEETPFIFPTVTQTDNFGSYNWLKNSTESAETIPSGETSSNLKYMPAVGGEYVVPDYDSTKSYGIIQWQEIGGTTSGRTEFSIIESNGKIKAENNSNSALNFYQAKIAVCSSSLATVITVYNSNNTPYNAFKYTRYGINYYYVLDGVQSDWTDDLSSIGYSLDPVSLLPTVSTDGDISVGNWTYPVGGTTTLESNTTVVLKNDLSGGSEIAFDSNVCYAVMYWFYNSSNRGTNGSISVVNVNDKLSAKNDTNSSLNFYAAGIAVCSSNHATIITVYDSSNVAFNAFKYTLDGTDYYYVLDQTQTDWTDDLSSIGYSLEPTVLYAYPQSGGEAGLANSSWSKGSYYTVYNPNGDYISPSPSYTITAVYHISNNVLTKYDNEYAFKFNFRYSASYLQARQNNSTSYNVAKIEYKDLPTEKAYLNQTSHSSNWDFPYNTNTLLYADDGSYIPYDTSKRYVMTCASKKDGTLVAAELTPVNMDGYLGYRVSSTGQACFIYYTMS